jgi:hypothetical protein
MQRLVVVTVVRPHPLGAEGRQEARVATPVAKAERELLREALVEWRAKVAELGKPEQVGKLGKLGKVVREGRAVETSSAILGNPCRVTPAVQQPMVLVNARRERSRA